MLLKRRANKLKLELLRSVKLGLLLLASGLVTSCSSTNVNILPDRFETDVLADGSKRFLFEVRSGPGAGRREGRDRLNAENMRLALDSYFELQPFCEEGYFLYDQGFDGNAYTILGECQESAE